MERDDESSTLSGCDRVEHSSRAAGVGTDGIAIQIARLPIGSRAGRNNQCAPKPMPSGELLDINSASAEELDKLPGVGPARAKAIIAHRPYFGKDDLVNKKIIPSNVYAQIKDKIIARQK